MRLRDHALKRLEGLCFKCGMYPSEAMTRAVRVEIPIGEEA